MKELRELTSKEIENILDFIKPNRSIPKEAALAIVSNMKNRFRSQLVGQKIYPELIPQLKNLLEKNYKESLIQPGESVGIIAAQSIGEKNTQSSVSFNEFILIKQGDDIKKIKIGEFIDDYIDKFGKVKLTNGSEIQICKDVYVLTVSQNEKIEWKEINEVSRHPPHGDLVKLTTESGRNIITTFSHSHLKKDLRKIIPVLGSELKVGDQIPVIKNSPIPQFAEELKEFDISEYITGSVGPREYDPDSDDDTNAEKDYFFFQNQRIKRYIKNDELFSWFIGIFLTCGKFDDHGITITSSDNSVEFQNNLDKFCDDYDIHKDDISNHILSIFGMKPYNYIYYLNSKILKEFLIKICGPDKKIPDFIFGCNKNIVKSLLYTYFRQNKFRKDQSFRLKDISFLLTYFGLYSCIESEKLFIHTSSLKEFSSQFGFEMTEINIKNFTNNIYNTSDSEFLKNVDRNTKRNIPMDDLKYYEQLMSSDVVWESIVKLELVTESNYLDKYGTHVYDFSISGNETFALLSGIVVHNTLNTLKKGKLYQKYS